MTRVLLYCKAQHVEKLVLTYWDCTGEHGSQMFVPSPLTLSPVLSFGMLNYNNVIMLQHLNKTVRTVFFFLLFIFILCDTCTNNITLLLISLYMTSSTTFWLCFQEYYA